jgi:multicomponent Na+:H+ antiporter subunit C
MSLLPDYLYYLGAFGLIFIGLYVILVKKNLIRVIIGLSLLETGVNLFIVSLGYVRSGTAPIFTGSERAAAPMVDPIPQALVLTSIVIGVAVLALALSLAVRVHRHFGTLDLRKIKEQRW